MLDYLKLWIELAIIMGQQKVLVGLHSFLVLGQLKVAVVLGAGSVEGV